MGHLFLTIGHCILDIGQITSNRKVKGTCSDYIDITSDLIVNLFHDSYLALAVETDVMDE